MAVRYVFDWRRFLLENRYFGSSVYLKCFWEWIFVFICRLLRVSHHYRLFFNDEWSLFTDLSELLVLAQQCRNLASQLSLLRIENLNSPDFQLFLSCRQGAQRSFCEIWWTYVICWILINGSWLQNSNHIVHCRVRQYPLSYSTSESAIAFCHSFSFYGSKQNY